MFTVLITGPPGAGKTSVLALGAEQRFLVRLEAPPTTLVERIAEREPESWSGLAGLVEHTQELAVTMPALQDVDLVLSTDGERPETVAQRIRAALPGEATRRRA